MVVRHGRAGGSRGIQCRCPNQSRKDPFINDALVKQWANEWDIRFAVDLYAEELVGQRIDNDEHIAKLRRNYSPPIISAMLRPDDVNLIVA